MSIDHEIWMTNLAYWWDILNWHGIVSVVTNIALGWASFQLLGQITRPARKQ